MASASSPDPKEPLRRYLQVQREADKRTLAIMRDVLHDIERQMRALEARRGVGAAVRRSQIAAARAAALRATERAWQRLGDNVRAQAAAAAKAAAEVAAKYDDEFLDRLGLSAAEREIYQDGLRQSARLGVENALNRAEDTAGVSRRTLSERVYQSRAWADNLLERRINSGLARGLSAREMAGEIRGLVRPDVRGGVSYAANRLARTEINNAFHLSQINNAKGKPWIIGMRWLISSSHPKPDDCDNIANGGSRGLPAGVYRVDNVPSKPHPHCLCSLEPVSMDPAEFERRMAKGDFDSWQKANIPSAPVPSGPKPMSQRTSRNKEVQDIRSANRKTVKAWWSGLDSAARARVRQTIVSHSQGPIHIRMSQKALRAMLDAQRFKTAHEVRKGEVDYMKVRRGYEDDIMGLEGVAAADRPAYGYAGDIESASAYGDYAVTLGDAAHARATFSAGDSLNGALDVRRADEIADLTDEELLGMIGSTDRYALADGSFITYMEAQVPNVRPADIGRIRVPSDAPEDFVADLRKAGFQIDVEVSEEERELARIREILNRGRE